MLELEEEERSKETSTVGSELGEVVEAFNWRLEGEDLVKGGEAMLEERWWLR